MSIDLKTRVAVSPEVMLQESAANPCSSISRSECYFGLDAVGTRIWQLVEQDGNLEAVHAALLDEYDVDAARLEHDVKALIERLVEVGLVNIEAPGADRLDRWRGLARGRKAAPAGLALLLPAIGGALRCLGVRRTYRLLGGAAAGAGPASAVPLAAQASAVRLGQLLDIASRHGPYAATCLRKSLALWWLLRRRGLSAELRIGVAKVDAQMQAHAWVELAGRVINDRATVADDYAVYEDLDRHLPRRVDVRDAR